MQIVPEPPQACRNVAGVDTHGEVHVAAVIDPVGRVLGTEAFDTTPSGYQQLLAWIVKFGPVERIGIEGTGSWGKGLARAADTAGFDVVEVTRPNRQRRRKHGKSDAVDAVSAALAVLNGDATARAKTGDGPAERLRMIHNAREGAVKARTAARNEFHAQLVTAPEEIRQQLRALSHKRAIRTAARTDRAFDPTDTSAVAWTVLAAIAQRVLILDDQVNELDRQRRHILDTYAPSTLRERLGVGDWVAAQLIITAGDNPDRIRSEAALAALCGVSCVQASTGNTQRHRLNRGGDRQANRALYTIAITRMQRDERTRTYVQRRRSEGKTTREIIRCLKRHIARELYPDLLALT